VSDLPTASRQELIQIIVRLRQQVHAQQVQFQEAERLALLVEGLEARLRTLEEELARLRGGGAEGGKTVPAWVKPNRPPREKKDRTRRGQAFVRRRERADEYQEHAVANCPECGRKLHGGWVHRRRQVIEILPPRVRVIEHVVVARRCGICRKRWLPKLEAGALGVQGKRRVGVSVQSLVALLHARYRVPLREVRRLLAELCGLRLSDGEMVALLEGVAQAGAGELKQLREAVRGSPVVCADETGWRQDGKNGWLWTFATPTLRYFVYRDTRSGRVPEEVLGEAFGGIVSCDCYVGYNRLLAEKQRCWAHLLRDLHALKEAQAEELTVVAWGEAIQALYAEAKAFVSASPQRRRRARRGLEVRLDALVRPVSQQAKSPQAVLAQRIRGHLLEWFVFVEHPEVPSTNNLAERSLRPAVIARKISGGTRSAQGSTTKTELMSLLGTWAVQGKPLLATCQHLLRTCLPTRRVADSPA
jgi:transposase